MKAFQKGRGDVLSAYSGELADYKEYFGLRFNSAFGRSLGVQHAAINSKLCAQVHLNHMSLAVRVIQAPRQKVFTYSTWNNKARQRRQ